MIEGVRLEMACCRRLLKGEAKNVLAGISFNRKSAAQDDKVWMVFEILRSAQDDYA